MQTSKFPLWICALALCGGMTLRADDTPAQAAARAALIQTMQEMEGNSSTATQTPVAVQPAPSAPAPVVVAPTPPPAAAAPAPAIGQAGDTDAQAQARAALGKKMAEIGTPSSPTVITTTTPSPGAVKTTTTSLKPITAPPLPINMSKAGKLDWLLSQYKADQITPEQYQKQRAAILAEP